MPNGDARWRRGTIRKQEGKASVSSAVRARFRGYAGRLTKRPQGRAESGRSVDHLLGIDRIDYFEADARLGRVCQATAPRPFFATNVRSFSEAPRGRFTPRSHWLTKPVVTLR